MGKTKNSPIVIDVFSGVGGLSLGAARAGFDVAATVDNDERAVGTHTRNFPNSIHVSKTVRSLSGKALLESADLKAGELDGLIGGPPCQGFSVIGRRRLEDRRNDLFSHFFRLVAETRPKFFLAENVPGILLNGYESIRERAIEPVRDSYVVLDPFSVTASDFGTPTKRTRVFFMGYRKDKVTDLNKETFLSSAHRRSVLVKDALRGLPWKIDPAWQTEEQGWRPIGKLGSSSFEKRISGHVPLGVGDPTSLERYNEKGLVSGCLGTVHEPNVVSRFELLRPGEKDAVSKAIRLDPNGLCPTLRAGTDSNHGSYQAVRPIHPRQPRVITPREAARLQGFPDWFVFHPTKWHSFRQIGNSVSPIVAETLLSTFKRSLR